jgi:DNA-binding IclR family transcriptional regulator
VARSIALCEADNEVRRIMEEQELLLREMTAHLQYLQQLLAQQEGMEAALLAAQQSPSSRVHEAATALVAAGYVQLGGAGRYQPSAVQLVSTAAAVSGALSWLRIAKLEVQQLLTKAVDTIGSLNEDGVSGLGVAAAPAEPDSEGSDYAPESDAEDVEVAA